MKLRIACSLTAVAGLVLVSLALGQEKAPRLTFEVAAIRPAQPDARSGGIKPRPAGDGYLVQNMPVKIMISLMYKVPSRQITGGPDWLNTTVGISRRRRTILTTLTTFTRCFRTCWPIDST